MKSYIVILNYNSWQDTVESALSVINGSCNDYQIIIMDNNSINDSQAMIQKWLDGEYNPKQSNALSCDTPDAVAKGPLPYVLYDQGRHIKRDLVMEQDVLKAYEQTNANSAFGFPILFVQTGQNLGFAGGNNVALKSLVDSDEDAFVLLLNPDVTLHSDALAHLYKSFAPRATEQFVSGLTIMDYHQPDRKMSSGVVRIFKPIGLIRNVTDDREDADYVYGGALFTNTCTLRRVGLLPEEYFLYWEETDWCTRAKRLDIPFYLCSEAICYDKVGTSIGRGFISEYFFTRNSFYYYRKFFPYYLPTLFLFQVMRLFIKLTKLRTDLARGIGFALIDVISGRRRNVTK